MTDQEKTQAREAVAVAIKQLEFILDLHGSHLEYHYIAAIYSVLEKLRSLQWGLYAGSCYA